MSLDILRLDPRQRAREKAACREEDRRQLNSGQASEADIAARNDFFASLDIWNFRIWAIGRKGPFAERGRRR
jgi:hypothetical protein